MLNKTHIEHTLIALFIQIFLSLFIDPILAGTIAISALSGREYAQVEYKVRDSTGISLTKMMPWHVLRPSLWSLDNILDVVIPAIVCYVSHIYLIPLISGA